MQPPYRRAEFQRQTQEVPQLAGVDARDKRGHQHYAQPGLGAAAHGIKLALQQGAAAQYGENVVIRSVKLKIDRVQTCIPQRGGIAGLPPQAYAVAVQLHECKSPSSGHGDDFGQIFPHGGFSARKLYIARPGNPPQPFKLKCNPFQRGLRGRERHGVSRI